MNERLKRINYKDQEILFADFSTLKGQDIISLVNEINKEIIQKASKDVLFLINIENAVIDPKALEAFKNSGKVIAPYLLSSAAFGISGLKKLFMNVVNQFSSMGVHPYNTEEEAKEALVKAAQNK